MLQCSYCGESYKECGELDKQFLLKNKKCLNCSLIDGEEFCTKCLSSFKRNTDNWNLIKERGMCFVCLVRLSDVYRSVKPPEARGGV